MDALLITGSGDLNGLQSALAKKAAKMLAFVGTRWKFNAKGVKRGGSQDTIFAVFGVACMPDRAYNKVQLAATDQNGRQWCFPVDSLYERVS